MPKLVGTDPDSGGLNEQKVTADGLALTLAITESDFERQSEKGLAYNWTSKIVDVDAGDTILLIKNESALPLKVESFTINNGSVASQYQIHLPTAEVTPTGTAVSATILNTGKSVDPDVGAKSDETNNTQGNIIFTPMMAVDSNFTQNTVGLILGKNKSLAIDVVEDTSESSVTIRAHY